MPLRKKSQGTINGCVNDREQRVTFPRSLHSVFSPLLAYFIVSWRAGVLSSPAVLRMSREAAQGLTGHRRQLRYPVASKGEPVLIPDISEQGQIAGLPLCRALLSWRCRSVRTTGVLARARHWHWVPKSGLRCQGLEAAWCLSAGSHRCS